MSKKTPWITLERVKESSNCFVIKQQVNKLKRNGFYFLASNGVVISSQQHPEYMTQVTELRIRGMDRSKDKKEVYISSKHVDPVLIALDELN